MDIDPTDGSKRTLKVDLHTHILPKNLPDLKKKYGYGGFVNLEHEANCKTKMMIDGKFFREVDPNCYSTEERIKECDATGVDVQVLSTIPVMFSYWAKPEHCLDLSQYLNNHVAQCVEENPKRFVGLGTLPMQKPEMAATELRRCVVDLGLAGVQIGTHINEWNLDAPELYPVWEEAERVGASIFVHPWDMMGKEKMPNYWLPWLVGMPAETSLAICSMIFGGIFERFPNLKVAFAHGGGAFPITVGRIEHGWWVRPDLCAITNKENPRKYLGKFWVDSLVHDESALKFIVELFGADKVFLGSDYPFPLGEDKPGTLIQNAFGDKEEIKRKLLESNAFEFLGLSRDKFL